VIGRALYCESKVICSEYSMNELRGEVSNEK
jgi:hypothetical protein